MFYSVPVFPFNSGRSSGLFYLSRYFPVYIHRLIILQLHQSVTQVIKTIVFNSIFLHLVMTYIYQFSLECITIMKALLTPGHLLLKLFAKNAFLDIFSLKNAFAAWQNAFISTSTMLYDDFG